MNSPLLSICIPTFNRAKLVSELVGSILISEADLEVCVHVDGGSDDTFSLLALKRDKRLKINQSSNSGRASALHASLNLAAGKYVMLYDDDDWLDPDGIRQIMSDIANQLPQGCVGYIYHMEDEMGCRLGSAFPVDRSNFLSLRADHCVTGDKKEVVLTEALRAIMQPPEFRRVPTSLYWSRLANDYDVVCRNVSVGRKNYLQGGMTSSIQRLKRANPGPLVELYDAHIRGYFKSRYKSSLFFVRAVMGRIYYTLIRRLRG